MYIITLRLYLTKSRSATSTTTPTIGRTLTREFMFFLALPRTSDTDPWRPLLVPRLRVVDDDAPLLGIQQSEFGSRKDKLPCSVQEDGDGRMPESRMGPGSRSMPWRMRYLTLAMPTAFVLPWPCATMSLLFSTRIGHRKSIKLQALIRLPLSSWLRTSDWPSKSAPNPP